MERPQGIDLCRKVSFLRHLEAQRHRAVAQRAVHHVQSDDTTGVLDQNVFAADVAKNAREIAADIERLRSGIGDHLTGTDDEHMRVHGRGPERSNRGARQFRILRESEAPNVRRTPDRRLVRELAPNGARHTPRDSRVPDVGSPKPAPCGRSARRRQKLPHRIGAPPPPQPISSICDRTKSSASSAWSGRKASIAGRKSGTWSPSSIDGHCPSTLPRLGRCCA